MHRISKFESRHVILCYQPLFSPDVNFEISLIKSIKQKSNLTLPANAKANIKRGRKYLRHVDAMATVWSVWRPWSSTSEEPYSASLSGAAATLLWVWVLIISTKKRTLALSNIPASDYQHLSYFASTRTPLYLLHQILDKKWENNTFWIVGGHWRFWSDRHPELCTAQPARWQKLIKWAKNRCLHPCHPWTQVRSLGTLES